MTAPPVTPPAPPRTGDPSRRNLTFVAAAALLVVAGVVAAILLLNNGQEPVDGESQAGAGNSTSEPSRPQESSEEPSTDDAAPIPANGEIDFSQAGQLVIDYYGDVRNAAKRWAMLSTNAQSLFGDQDAFEAYWAQYTEVSSENARGVTKNPDGSVNVPVDVSYTKGSSPRQEHQTVRVTRVNGKLVIDSQAR